MLKTALKYYLRIKPHIIKLYKSLKNKFKKESITSVTVPIQPEPTKIPRSLLEEDIV